MADPKNGRVKRIFGGISITVVATALGLFFLISDRADESGQAKATIKSKVDAIEQSMEHRAEDVDRRVENLEAADKRVEKILYGESNEGGLVSVVNVIKSEIGAIKQQNVQILEKLDDLKKE